MLDTPRPAPDLTRLQEMIACGDLHTLMYISENNFLSDDEELFLAQRLREFRVSHWLRTLAGVAIGVVLTLVLT